MQARQFVAAAALKEHRLRLEALAPSERRAAAVKFNTEQAAAPAAAPAAKIIVDL